MPDVEAKIEEIRSSGDAADDVAAGFRAIDVSALSNAAAGMPGSQAAELFAQVEAKLAKQITDTSTGYSEFAGAMHSAADLYSSNEQAAIDALGVAAPAGQSPK